MRFSINVDKMNCSHDVWHSLEASWAAQWSALSQQPGGRGGREGQEPQAAARALGGPLVDNSLILISVFNSFSNILLHPCLYIHGKVYIVYPPSPLAMIKYFRNNVLYNLEEGITNK